MLTLFHDPTANLIAKTVFISIFRLSDKWQENRYKHKDVHLNIQTRTFNAPT